MKRFNRTIVELRHLHTTLYSNVRLSFNRTIVELRLSGTSTFKIASLSVLIEP